MPTLTALNEAGQAVWLDFLSRDFIESGALQSHIDSGVRGVTANPTILDKAISGSQSYDDDIYRMALLGKSDQEIYEGLVSVDIGKTADLFDRCTIGWIALMGTSVSKSVRLAPTIPRALSARCATWSPCCTART